MLKSRNAFREEKLYGEPMTEANTKLVYDESSEIPESKSNNVSFMKVEELPVLCRNILAVSESYICYSVTQKKNLLRVIDTQLGEKVILRGHEHAVLDLKFAAVDAGLLCSVDAGGSEEVSGKPHIIVWKKHEQGEWKVFAELPVRASMVRPHPLQAHVWLVAHEGRLAVFSSQRSAAAPVSSYEALSMHVSLPAGETVKGTGSTVPFSVLMSSIVRCIMLILFLLFCFRFICYCRRFIFFEWPTHRGGGAAGQGYRCVYF